MEHRVIYVLVLVCALTLSSLAQGQQETCTVAPHHRDNCGSPGITPSQCKDKGCCFDNTVRGVPWCYYPVAVDNPPEGMASVALWGLRMQNQGGNPMGAQGSP
uniref:Trefoil factor 1 n=1 Tax=Canis lupus familiaris TaxID=9615 RepID=A0A8C0TT63_CANLF